MTHPEGHDDHAPLPCRVAYVQPKMTVGHRRGHAGGRRCVAGLDGEVEMRKNDCLTDRDLGDGWRLTCQAVPQSRVVKVDWDAS